MKYTSKSFTLPVTGKKMTDQQYEIAVGLRCANCKKLTEKCKCK